MPTVFENYVADIEVDGKQVSFLYFWLEKKKLFEFRSFWHKQVTIKYLFINLFEYFISLHKFLWRKLIYYYFNFH